eukprot:9499758-Pyramimonas_sp.AAC.1
MPEMWPQRLRQLGVVRELLVVCSQDSGRRAVCVLGKELVEAGGRKRICRSGCGRRDAVSFSMRQLRW